MRIAVYGAGAIGGHIAARLARKGAAVSVIARGGQLAAMRARGLTIHAPDESFTVPVHAVGEPAALGAQDAVLVTVKAPALGSVAGGIAPLLGAGTRVVFVLNGIPWWYLGEERLAMCDPGDAVRRAVGLERTVGAVVHSACTVVEPGVIRVGNARSRLVLGRPDDAADEGVAAIAAALEQPGYAGEVAPRIREAVWSKLLGNLGSGPFTVLGGAAPRAVFTDDVVAEAARAVFAEGFAVARALGVEPRFDPEAVLRGFAAMEHRPSILQDLDLGRPMEIDGIYTSTQALARRAGVATPMLDLVVALMKGRARAAGLYGGA